MHMRCETRYYYYRLTQYKHSYLLLGDCGGGPLAYIALERRPSAVTHVKRMRVSKRRQPAESSKRGQMPLVIAALAGAAERMIRGR